MSSILYLGRNHPPRALNGGLFVSRGKGTHPARVMDSYELILVRRGSLGMGELDETWDLSAGQTLILWPGRRHHGTRPYPRDLSFYWIHFQMPRVRQSRNKALPVPQTVTLPEPERLTELCHRFLNDQQSGRLAPLQGDLLMGLMLCEVAEAARRASVAQHPPAVLAERAKVYLATHFHLGISARHVADALDCNPDYLGRVFKGQYGCSLVEALHRQRVKEARVLLIEGRWNMGEIARECGFENAGYFRRIFKRHTGTTPRAFRERHARVHVLSR